MRDKMVMEKEVPTLAKIVVAKVAEKRKAYGWIVVAFLGLENRRCLEGIVLHCS